jgi:UDP-glucose 4-epimerase
LAEFIVTGGAGFIGSHIVDKLIEGGRSVAIIDDLSTGFRHNINPKATFHESDIRDADAMARIFDREKPRYVIHHAAQMDVRKSTQDPVFDAQTNILGGLYLILNSRRLGVAKFIYASTGGALYGEPEDIPATEETPINPISEYGASKHTVEHYLFIYRHNFGLNYTVLRYANVFGPRQNPEGEAGVIAIFTKLMLDERRPIIYGDGTSTRDYVHVDDVVQANMLALERGDGGVYNIGLGREVSVQEVFDALAAAMGYKGQPRYDPPRLGEIYRIALSPKKARAELGWTPKYDLESGIAQTVDYYRSRRRQ